MKIAKSVLVGALKVLGSVVAADSPEGVLRSVRVVGDGRETWLWATDGAEVVMLRVEAVDAEVCDFAVEYRALRELVRSARGGVVELRGERLSWPEVEAVPVGAVRLPLPEDFTQQLATAASVVDRQEAREVLRGIQLSRDGLAATNGRELVHIPTTFELPRELVLPYPGALLAAGLSGPGTLSTWEIRHNRFFRLELDGFVWLGRAVAGSFPDWRRIIPEATALDYSISFEAETAAKLAEYLRKIPTRPPHCAVELNVVPGGIEVVPRDAPEQRMLLPGRHDGVRPRAVLALNRDTLLRMLQLGYSTFRAYSDGMIPVVAEGGCGRFIAMPLRITPEAIINREKEKNKMEENRQAETVEPVNFLEELTGSIEELRGKLKTLLDESVALSRKLKEAVLRQKQKEREFAQAKRAIERIRAVSGF